MARQIAISDYTYHLPTDKIAYAPLPKRDESKLLVYKDGEIEESKYLKIADYLPSNSLVIFNNTKVIEARIIFQKVSGSKIEIFCLEPSEIYPDIVTGMTQKGSVEWNCLIGGASKWKDGNSLKKQLQVDGITMELEAFLIEKKKDFFKVAFSWQPIHFSFAEMLHHFGQMPLPPYIKREAGVEDQERYQTIYAREEGSVAAPTAGLHFSKGVMDSLFEKQITPSYATLHVGAGTFKPVNAPTMEEHEMHSEYLEISQELLEALLRYPVLSTTAIGTTSLRTLESIYWLGVKATLNPTIDEKEMKLLQWDSYELDESISREVSLLALLNWLKKKAVRKWLTTTQLLIAPGYKIKMVQRLVTNFHQPNSTLLLLVAAFIGDDWKKVYEFALQNEFRFLSYGDGCLLEKKNQP